MVALGVPGADGDAVEQAEAHALGGAGVVARWTHGAEGVFHLAGHDGIDGVHDTADGAQRDVEGARADHRVAGAEFASAGFDIMPGGFEVLAGMAEQNVIRLRRLLGKRHALLREAALLQGLNHSQKPRRSFRMTRAGFVGTIDGVKQEAGLGRGVGHTYFVRFIL